jgi:hypothetical protein
MARTTRLRPIRILDPMSRVSELLFGLIMVLTFTGSISAAESGREDIRLMLLGALGCNLAWGLVDAVMYLMGRLADQGRELIAFRNVRRLPDPAEAHRAITDAVPDFVGSVLGPAELEAVRERVARLPEPPSRPRLRREDFVGAVGVFLIVFLSTFPVAIPFLFGSNAVRSLRISNAVAIVMLFLTGLAFGRCAGHRPWVMGFSMVILGLLLVGATIALGG